MTNEAQPLDAEVEAHGCGWCGHDEREHAGSYPWCYECGLQRTNDLDQEALNRAYHRYILSRLASRGEHAHNIEDCNEWQRMWLAGHKSAEPGEHERTLRDEIRLALGYGRCGREFKRELDRGQYSIYIDAVCAVDGDGARVSSQCPECEDAGRQAKNRLAEVAVNGRIPACCACSNEGVTWHWIGGARFWRCAEHPDAMPAAPPESSTERGKA